MVEFESPTAKTTWFSDCSNVECTFNVRVNNIDRLPSKVVVNLYHRKGLFSNRMMASQVLDKVDLFDQNVFHFDFGNRSVPSGRYFLSVQTQGVLRTRKTLSKSSTFNILEGRNVSSIMLLNRLFSWCIGLRNEKFLQISLH